MDEKLQQLAALKTATIHFGVVHEYQVHQLKNYPLLISGAKQPWTVELNNERKLVVYNLNGRRTKKSVKDMEYVRSIIQTYLLWNDTEVNFNWNVKKK